MRQRAARPSYEELGWILECERVERERELEYGRASLHPAFGRGYDSDRWPFDIQRAIASPGYRKGIYQAINNPWFNKQWRSMALHEFATIVVPALKKRVKKLRALAAYYGVEGFQ